MRLGPVLLITLTIPSLASGAEYACKVERKFNSEHVYTASEIEKWKLSIKIEESSSSSLLSRCSFSAIAEKVTCDQYAVDKVVYDDNASVKKYYVFRSQFDVQLFQDLFFIENNGRGDIAFGHCILASP